MNKLQLNKTIHEYYLNTSTHEYYVTAVGETLDLLYWNDRIHEYTNTNAIKSGPGDLPVPRVRLRRVLQPRGPGYIIIYVYMRTYIYIYIYICTHALYHVLSYDSI